MPAKLALAALALAMSLAGPLAGPVHAISGGGGKGEKRGGQPSRALSLIINLTLTLHNSLSLSVKKKKGDLSEANYKDLTGMDLRGKKLYKAQFRATTFDKAGERERERERERRTRPSIQPIHHQ